ncbi:efflux RND transporter periplasmic adaptor subunit [Thioalkalivibrio sp. ALJT]|uniref:efflux RND transporter periplasmic adaptor subunit n=1 Tax=Thioalkalivibrio sp. ALJT TaxID=1158146 RepID=UPI0003809699|nr:efflux RND transporter periplasmic adaptor subunit [Thioalkalivibrio sp. ALJT]
MRRILQGLGSQPGVRVRLGLAAAVVVVLLVLLMLLPSGERLPEGAVAVPIEERVVRAEVRADGELRASGQRALFAQVPGVVVTVAEGRGAVDEGDVLVELDDRQIRHEHREAEVAIWSAKAEQATANSRYEQAHNRKERVRRLADQDLIPREEFEQARAEYLDARAAQERAEAEVERAQVHLQRASEDLENTRVKSPFKGVLLSVHAEPGQPVSSTTTTPLAEIAPSLDEIRVMLDVHEADVGQVQSGQTVRFAIEARPGSEHEAVVEEVERGARNSDGVRLYRVIARAANDNGVFFPGMSARARIDVGDQSERLAVPVEALVYQPPSKTLEEHAEKLAAFRADDLTVIWVVGDSGRVEPAGVRIEFQDDEYAALEGADPDLASARVLLDE